MAYAIIKVNPKTTRIESARLYDIIRDENEFEVEHLPDGQITHYKYINNEYIYDDTIIEEEKKEQELQEEKQLINNFNDNLIELEADHEYRICMLELNSGISD